MKPNYTHDLVGCVDVALASLAPVLEIEETPENTWWLTRLVLVNAVLHRIKEDIYNTAFNGER